MTWTLITGAAAGLGRAIALELAGQGHSLVLHYRTRQPEAEELASLCHQKKVKAQCIQGDFSSTESTLHFIERYLAAFEKTQSLVNNVGNVLRKTGLDTQGEEWKALFQTNFHAGCQLISALSPSLKHTQGSIVNIGYAGVSQQVLSRYYVAYHASKTALWTVTKSFAEELAPFGVRVNMVSPGYLENSIVATPDPHKLPMQRLGTLEEVARVVAFLLDPKQSYITGQNIDVSGGVRL